MAFNFGGPVMVQTVPVETPAQRENRDIENMGVEDHYTAAAGGTVRDLSSATLSTIAFGATGGRKDREYLKRGGDDVLSGSVQNPTTTVAANGRNDREYVSTTDGTSAITSEKDPLYDELAANTGLYPF